MVLIVFIGGGLGFVGWFKQRYNAPLVSVSCSLASLAIITGVYSHQQECERRVLPETVQSSSIIC